MNYKSLQIRDVHKKPFDHSSVHSMPHFTVSFPSWWNSNERQMPQLSSMNMSLKVESTPKLFHDGKYLGLQLPDQESSSAQSIGQSHNEMGAVEGSNSQDQCISSDSGEDDGCGKGVEGRMKPAFLMSNSEIIVSQPHVDYNHPTAHTSYPYGDHYLGGLFSPYGGPQTLIHPPIGAQLVRIAPARVPLPLDPIEDGPIYVNPKQYHGILRRRKLRAKLEAQNRHVKTRKPYLHESRHLHALNRIRGSGGRFLSTKQLQQDITSSSSSNVFTDSTHLYKKNSMSELESYSENTEYVASTMTSSDITRVSNSDVIFRQPDCGSSGISVRLQNNGRHNNGRHGHGGMNHHALDVWEKGSDFSGSGQAIHPWL